MIKDDENRSRARMESGERRPGFFSAETAGALGKVAPEGPAEQRSGEDSRVPPPRLASTTCRPSVFAPFSVLLPRLGEVQSLVKYRDIVASRSRMMHGREPSGGTEEGLRAYVNEEAMLSQVLQWFGMQGEWEVADTSVDYTPELFVALYELGRLYYEMGYFGASERIFLGLSAVDREATPCRVGVGVVRLERGAFQEALNAFRAALRDPHWQAEAKLGLAAAFLARTELDRAATILSEIESEVSQPELQKLWRALLARCSS